MKKITSKIACTLACCALCFTGAGLSCALAKADEPLVSPLQNELIAPQTYREYLPLQNPSTIASCATHTAIADGKDVYVYYVKGDEYVKYSHTANVTKVQFDGNDNLYFLDADTYLYALPLSDFYTNRQTKATKQTLTCSSFLLAGDVVYYTIVSENHTSVRSLPVTNLTDSAATPKKLVENLTSETPIAFYNDELYYLEGKTLYRIPTTGEDNKPKVVIVFSKSLKSIVVTQNVFACITNENDFFVYGLSDVLSNTNSIENFTPYTSDKGGYTSLCTDGEYIYATKNNKVKQYSIQRNAFTSFEICSSSTSQNRLNGATTAKLVNDLLYVADVGNERISVYDVETNGFRSPIATELSVTHIAADESTLLAVSESQAVLYDVQNGDAYGTQLTVSDEFNGNIVGAENVFGTYYLATTNNVFYRLSKSENGWQWESANHLWSGASVKNIASDAEGRLYVSNGNAIVRFTETQFLNPSHAGETVCSVSLPAQTKSFSVDFCGNLYAYTDAKIFRLQEETWTEFPALSVCVYGAENHITSFTFGFAENAAYVLQDGNYITVTTGLDIPTVKTIAVDDADENVFAQTSVENVTLVQTQANALLIEFDLNALQNAEVFPYIAYYRASSPISAICIGETRTYNILAVFDDVTKTYAHYLALKSACTVVPESEHTVTYTESQQKTAYITNAVRLYKYPYLTDLLTVRTIERGDTITLLGEMNGGTYAYYRIRYTKDGTEYTGYVPKTFVTPFNPQSPETNEYSHGKPTPEQDGVWRFAYISLGFAAICILTDFLLLRRPKDEE